MDLLQQRDAYSVSRTVRSDPIRAAVDIIRGNSVDWRDDISDNERIRCYSFSDRFLLRNDFR
jgi:hypothetical protein